MEKEMKQNTTIKISKETMRQLVRSRGLIQRNSPKEKITFDKAVLYLCGFFEKNTKLKTAL